MDSFNSALETPIYNEVMTVCTIPPKGWYCSRVKGHNGPCAAHPDEIVSKPTFLEKNVEARKYIYNVAIVVLGIVVGWQGFEAVSLQSWEHLVFTILNIGGIGATALARANVR